MSATQRRGSLRKAGAASSKLPPGCVFHAEKRQPIFALADFVDRQNVGMIETGGGFGFAAEARQRLARIGVMAEDAFERDDATGMALPGAINYPHATACDLIQNLIVAETPLRVVKVDLTEDGSEPFAITSFASESRL